MTFRRWKRRQAIEGRRYRTPGGIVQVDSVTRVAPEAIGDGDARRAGYDSADTLRADLRGKASVPLTRVVFHLVDEPDPRTVLAADDDLEIEDVAALDRRLDQMDARAPSGPWTAGVLSAIAANPGLRAGELAASLGRERLSFKADVRKLKELGLTMSLEVGYRLSPRGEAYLARTERR